MERQQQQHDHERPIRTVPGRQRRRDRQRHQGDHLVLQRRIQPAVDRTEGTGPRHRPAAVALLVELQRAADRAEVRRNAQHRGHQRPVCGLPQREVARLRQRGERGRLQPGVPELHRLVAGERGTALLPRPVGIGTGYRAAPEVFYFAPQNLWYLVYQDGNAAYSTNPDINNPAGWTAPKHFYPEMPKIIRDNIGNGYWVDMWVICDTADCHLFSSDDNGHLYRSQTPIGNFPNGMSEPVIAAQDPDRYKLFEAANVYKVDGSNQYLLLVEAIGAQGRYFRSWTSTSIAGPYTPLADAEGVPFAGPANVTFPGGAWTRDISHGEMIRTGTDQTLTISPCNMRYLYQGRDPNSGGDYNSLPWRLGLLTQTNSTC
ncbi:non-reducing end alpha-L-arabinofuranosidase family hydrolase [Lentzea indica]|uniref:non-reducing end alpha-L-arabinofuranosidase family hydrolase n=1 Tax=Lentzea indica TaxID=2604800 RepID=UPI0028ACBED1|nr:non-reducing end alpha-L-arabinofuranosidase family hydrolase [Lentzea indica]